jgi:hypothetical protein
VKNLVVAEDVDISQILSLLNPLVLESVHLCKTSKLDLRNVKKFSRVTKFTSSTTITEF